MIEHDQLQHALVINRQQTTGVVCNARLSNVVHQVMQYVY